ncbi:MAG: chorismate synthase [Spirochaetes bacterium]|nr:MAG: chorismate synthase [Spirochaetota bacterium]
MRIVITGPKCSGKSTIGAKLAELTGLRFVETDTLLEEICARESGEPGTCREICAREGEPAFREWERRTVRELAGRDWCVIATGGGTMADPDSRRLLLEDSILILLKAPIHLLWERMQKTGLPPFLSCADGLQEFEARVSRLYESVEHLSDMTFTVTAENERDAHREIAEILSSLMSARMHSPSTFGEIIRTTTFGESHGPAVGAVMDGLPPGIPVSPADIQAELDRRRPGQSAVTTPRSEDDAVHILSGVFEGKTTGTPLCLVVYNRDQDSTKYEALREVFRPGHADFTFWKKYGMRDHRGGGRSSGRETAGRVAAGAVALSIVRKHGIAIFAFAQEIAGIEGTREDLSFIEKNPVRAADPERAGAMEEAVMTARREHDSVGGIVKLIVKNVPAGLGDPVFFKLDARLGAAFFSIGAVKGVEFGSGFAAARQRGSANNDPMDGTGFLSNNAGGILGGISSGADITARIAIKPTPSIARPQSTVDVRGAERAILIEGRHDPCIVPRVIPVIESMTALVLADALAIQEKIAGGRP